MNKNFYIQSIFPEYDTNKAVHALKENSREARDKAYRELQKSKNFGLEYCANSIKFGKYGIPRHNDLVSDVSHQQKICRTGTTDAVVFSYLLSFFHILSYNINKSKAALWT